MKDKMLLLHPFSELTRKLINMQARIAPAMDYISTDFCTDSSRHFSFRKWTDRHTKSETQLITLTTWLCHIYWEVQRMSVAKTK